jgi:hypothetical protein
MITPWGNSQTIKEIAPGIIRVTTASHGGYHLTPERLAQMPEAQRETAYSTNGWFEEDVDWSLVAVNFPEAFHPDEVKAAKNYVARFFS